MFLFITSLLLCSLLGCHLKLDPNHIHSTFIQSYLPKNCAKKMLNMEIVFLSFTCNLCWCSGEIFSWKTSDFASCFPLSWQGTENIKQWNKMNSAHWKLFIPCLNKAKPRNGGVIFSPFIWCNFLYIVAFANRSRPCPAADWSHFSREADGWGSVPDHRDSYWTLLGAGHMDINRHIRATKPCEMCPSSHSVSSRLCVLTDGAGIET